MGSILFDSLLAVTQSGSVKNFIQEFKILVSQANQISKNWLREYFFAKLQALCKKNKIQTCLITLLFIMLFVFLNYFLTLFPFLK